MNKKILSIVSIVLVIALMATVLVACNAESVTKKLEKAEYDVATLADIHVKVDESKLEWSVAGIKKGGAVAVMKFLNTDDAKAFQENFTEIKFGQLELKCERSMKVVYVGNTQGIKDAK